MSAIEHHIAELEIAARANDPRRTLPVLPEKFSSILDVGCGIGQTLLSGNFPADVLVCGVDIDEMSLRTGSNFSDRLKLACAVGESLPFAEEAFDVVISRVALPYMHIPQALSEIARVTKRGGQVWLALHPFAFTRKWLWQAVKTGHVKSTLTQSYSLVNGLFFHFTGKQFRFPLKRTHCESFQTVGAMTRALTANGFQMLRVDAKGETLAVTARKV